MKTDIQKMYLVTGILLIAVISIFAAGSGIALDSNESAMAADHNAAITRDIHVGYHE
jgi:high-affinity Fe2+/Pb2+ permease